MWSEGTREAPSPFQPQKNHSPAGHAWRTFWPGLVLAPGAEGSEEALSSWPLAAPLSALLGQQVEAWWSWAKLLGLVVHLGRPQWLLGASSCSCQSISFQLETQPYHCIIHRTKLHLLVILILFNLCCFLLLYILRHILHKKIQTNLFNNLTWLTYCLMQIEKYQSIFYFRVIFI